MITRSLTKQEVEAEPFRVWNAYVDLLAMEKYGALSREQRPAFLVFWYESEVQNGGHFQYFENRGTEHFYFHSRGSWFTWSDLSAAGSSRSW